MRHSFFLLFVASTSPTTSIEEAKIDDDVCHCVLLSTQHRDLLFVAFTSPTTSIEPLEEAKTDNDVRHCVLLSTQHGDLICRCYLLRLCDSPSELLSPASLDASHVNACSAALKFFYALISGAKAKLTLENGFQKCFFPLNND